jgi:hypothetical protein
MRFETCVLDDKWVSELREMSEEIVGDVGFVVRKWGEGLGR